MKFEKLAWYKSRPNGLCFIFALLFFMQGRISGKEGDLMASLLGSLFFLVLSLYYRQSYRSERGYLFTSQEVKAFENNKEAKEVLSVKAYFLRLTIYLGLAYLLDFTLIKTGLITESNTILMFVAYIYTLATYPSDKREQARWDALVVRAKKTLEKKRKDGT